MSNITETITEEWKQEQHKKETKEHMVQYIKIMKQIKDCIEPYTEFRKELTKEYKDNGWLSKEDIKKAKNVVKLIEEGFDLEEIEEAWKVLDRRVEDED